MAQQSCEQDRFPRSHDGKQRDPSPRWTQAVGSLGQVGLCLLTVFRRSSILGGLIGMIGCSATGCWSSPSTPPRDRGSTTTATTSSVALARGEHRGCDPLVEGCPPNERCTVDIARPPRCRPRAETDAKVNETCLPGRCDLGLTCVRSAATATVGRCLPICRTDTGEGCERWGNQWACSTRIPERPAPDLPQDLPARDDHTRAAPAWGACEQRPRCDPGAAACEAGMACQPYLQPDAEWTFRCQPAGQQQADEPCSPGNCASGLACVAFAEPSKGVCRRLCRDNIDCPQPEQCVGIVDQPRFLFCSR